MDILTTSQMLDVVESDLLKAGLRKEEVLWFYCWLPDQRPEAKKVEDPAFMEWFRATDRVRLVAEFREHAAQGLAEAAAAAEERPCP
jgi:hypothetical protein